MRKDDDNQNTRVYRRRPSSDKKVNRRPVKQDDFDLISDDDLMNYVPGVDDIDHFDFDEKDVAHYRKVNEQEALEKERKRRIQAKQAAAARRKKLAESQKMADDSDKTQSSSAVRKTTSRTKSDKAATAKTRTRSAKAKTTDADKSTANGAKIKRTRLAKKSNGFTRREMMRKRRTNKEILRVTYVMIIMFTLMIGYFIHFNVVQSKEIVNNVHNSRLEKLAQNIARGDIISADGKVLAETIKDSEGNYSRYYPYGNVFAHIIGTSVVNKSGIEAAADYDLTSTQVESMEKILNEITGKKSPGNNVSTTLNSKLQQAAYEAFGDREGAVVAIEPSTGKILAMISKPDYDPNELPNTYKSILNDEGSDVLLNKSTQGLFVPGSIFKVVTTLAYLRSGADPDEYEYECEGSINLYTDEKESYINCYAGEVHGYVNLKDSFTESCNASFANLGLSIGQKKMKEVAEQLLFNVELPTSLTTQKSRFSVSETDSDWEVGATAIGQGNTAMSPIHAAMLVSAIANGGNLMKPYVIDHVEDTEGTVLKQYSPESYGSLLTPSESSRLTDMMKSVVEEGTAYKLADKNYAVAGKTGTAELEGTEGNNAWFIGFAPADDPKIAICVLVQDAYTASKDAVPIAGEILDAYLDN